MKVGYVLDRYPVLTQTFVRLEVAELRRQGVEVEIFALRRGDQQPGPGESVTILRDDPGGKLRHAAAHARLGAGGPARYGRFLRSVRSMPAERSELLARRLPAIAEAVRSTGVEHLHAHFGWSGAAVARCLADLTGLPWSLTVHGNDLFAQTRNLHAKLAAADRVVTVCEYNRRWLVERHGIESTVVVCGVEVPEPWTRRTPDLDVVLVGRLVPKKGVDLLLAAARLLPTSTFEVVGDGPLRSALEEAAPPNVRFVGALGHEETLDRIARSRLLCVPARVAQDGDRDSMPLVVKEAMVREVAVVASDAVGLPEAVGDDGGWLVPPEDAGALAVAIEAALADPVELRRRGEAGRRRVLERFRLTDEVAKLRSAFELERCHAPAGVGD